MSGTVLSIIKVILFVSLFITKFGLGLSVVPGDLRFFRERRGLMVRSILTVVFLVPIAYVLLILLFRPDPAMAVAIALLAASPATPFAFGKAGKSGGHLAYAASLQFIVAMLSIVTTPLVLRLIGMTLDFEVTVHPARVAWQVFIAQLLPISLGVLVRAKFSGLVRAVRPFVKAATYIFLAFLFFIIVVQYRGFVQTSLLSYILVVCTTVVALALGHLLAPREPGMQTALALETAMRNPGLALLIAAMNFPQAKPLPILLPCVVVSIIVVTLYTLVMNRKKA
jgi:bile acid:Na+ symporter, BASS family